MNPTCAVFRSLLLLVIAASDTAWGQSDFPELRALKPMIDIKTGNVLPDGRLHEKGDGGLVLPDGSIVTTVWPAALKIQMYGDPASPSLPRRPYENICEPAVYSLARYTQEGKELWAKSYIFKGKIDKVCFAYYLTFDVFSVLEEVAKPHHYILPFNGRIVLEGASNTDGNIFEIDVETGEVFGEIPKGLRVIDAHELRKIKEKIFAELARKYPELEYQFHAPIDFRRKISQINIAHTRQRYQLFYKNLEAVLFPVD